MPTPRLRPTHTRTFVVGRPCPRPNFSRQFQSGRFRRQASGSESKGTIGPASVADRIAARLPPRLAHYASRVRAQPASSLAAFVVLHEVTAIAPLVFFYLALGYVSLSPDVIAWVESRADDAPSRTVEGLKGEEHSPVGVGNLRPVASGAVEDLPRPARILRRLGVYAAEERDDGSTGASPVVRAVAAYLITKALLPVRLWLSLRWAPGLARWTKARLGIGR